MISNKAFFRQQHGQHVSTNDLGEHYWALLRQLIEASCIRQNKIEAFWKDEIPDWDSILTQSACETYWCIWEWKRVVLLSHTWVKALISAAIPIREHHSKYSHSPANRNGLISLGILFILLSSEGPLGRPDWRLCDNIFPHFFMRAKAVSWGQTWTSSKKSDRLNLARKSQDLGLERRESKGPTSNISNYFTYPSSSHDRLCD